MFFNLLSGLTPPVEPVFDDRSTAMTVMLIVIVLLILAIIIAVTVLARKLSIQKRTHKQDLLIWQQLLSEKLPQEEQYILNKYRSLKDSDKQTIKQMLNSLNDNRLDKE